MEIDDMPACVVDDWSQWMGMTIYEIDKNLPLSV